VSFLTSILSPWLAGNELPLCSPQITSAPFSSKVTCRATIVAAFGSWTPSLMGLTLTEHRSILSSKRMGHPCGSQHRAIDTGHGLASRS
jgi:hypothetical protein